MKGHEIILNDFLGILKADVKSVLDAGSGRTSLAAITDSLPDIPVDAIIYPGDTRKRNSVAEIMRLNKNINVMEKDICRETIDQEYDLVVAHLLLGEATKFGNTFEDLLGKIITMKYKYLIIIDYLEDPAVKEDEIVRMCDANNLTVVYRSYFTNEQPQVWEKFTGAHNFGYLIKKS